MLPRARPRYSDAVHPPAQRAPHVRRLLPHQASAALRFRRGQPAQGQVPGRGHGHHRLRDGQPGHGYAHPYRRQAGRDGPPSAHASVFGVEGHSGAAAGAGGVLCAALRGEARSGDRGDRDAGLEGGAREPRDGDHRAGRRDAGAEPVLPDPPLRLHDRRRHAAARAGAARRAVRSRGVHPRAGAGGDPFGAEAGGDGGVLPVEPDGAGDRPRLLPRPDRLREEAPPVGAVGFGLCGDLFRRQPAAVDPAGRGREGRGGGVHVASARPMRCRAGAWGSRSATGG